MAHQIIILERAYRGIEHVNDLTATELSNQPEISILHSDSFFYYIVYLFCVLLETPNSYCIGINHLDLVVSLSFFGGKYMTVGLQIVGQ